MDQYLRARGVVSVFMTDDALGGGGSSWCGPWLLVGPSSLWREERLPARSQPQLHPEENCGVATGGEAGNWRALPNNNPEHELPPKPLTATKTQMEILAVDVLSSFLGTVTQCIIAKFGHLIIFENYPLLEQLYTKTLQAHCYQKYF